MGGTFSMRQKITTILILLVLALFSWFLSAHATIFSALGKEMRKAGEVKKNISSDYGLAKIDDSAQPPEVTVGETKALWKGHWQLGGGKLNIKRAETTSLLLTQDVTSLRFKIRWIGANEAVAQSANHKFWMKLYREKKDKSLTKLHESEKKVEVGKKGLGGTVFKKGYLHLPSVTTETPAWYKLKIGVKNLNTGAEISTHTYIHVERESPEGILDMECNRTSEFKKYNRCWGWHRTHTYFLGKEWNLTFLNVTAMAGPSELKGKKYEGWLIEGSQDGKNWRKIAEIKIVVGEKRSQSFDTSQQSKIKYIRINTKRKGYVDWSRIKVWVL
jgi:hypothetical protein